MKTLPLWTLLLTLLSGCNDSDPPESAKPTSSPEPVAKSASSSDSRPAPPTEQVAESRPAPPTEQVAESKPTPPAEQAPQPDPIVKPKPRARPQPPEGVNIWTAASTGNMKALRQHLAAGTNIDTQQPKSRTTPLMAAATWGKTPAAKLLIEKGAQLNLRNRNGSTALLSAAFFGHPETVELLLSSGADPNVQNHRGHTALDTATEPWGIKLSLLYRFLSTTMKMSIDTDKIQRVRPQIAELLRQHGGKAGRN